MIDKRRLIYFEISFLCFPERITEPQLDKRNILWRMTLSVLFLPDFIMSSVNMCAHLDHFRSDSCFVVELIRKEWQQTL